MAGKQLCGCACFVPLWIATLMGRWSVNRAVDVRPQEEIYIPDYSLYHNLTSIQWELQRMAHTYPDFIHIDWKYSSRSNRPQMLLHITNFTDGTKHKISQKTKLLFSYGEHAREFLPVESMFFLLKNLTGGLRFPKGSPREMYSRHILSNIELYIIAMANPDGRIYLERSHNYCWRGTSTGVDLNRNFDWEFAKKGSSSDPSDEEYRGPYAFSEPECLVYKHLTEEHNFDLYISFHSGIRQIYLPFADTKSHLMHRQPGNIKAMRELAAQLASSTQQHYQYGKAYDLMLYTADGTSFDYMAGSKKIPFSLAVELWGTPNHLVGSCFDQFNPRSENLKHEVSQIHPLYVKLFDYMIQWKLQQVSDTDDGHSTSILKVKEPAPSHTFAYLLLSAVVITLMVLAFQGRLFICHRWQNRRRVVNLKTLSSTLSLWGFVKSM